MQPASQRITAGERFPARGYNSGVEIALNQLPVPDWDLVCPQCSYPLRGLPEHRCPECGAALDIATIVKPWNRLRPPRFTGAERPLPDYGLHCGTCARPLAGAPGNDCPACHAPFDLEALRPLQEWFVLDGTMCQPLPVPGVQGLLLAEYVPHYPVGERSATELYTGHGSLYDRLRVAREFYFEVLWLIERTRRELEEARSNPRPAWHCGACGERNPGNFELCWNCEAARP